MTDLPIYARRLRAAMPEGISAYQVAKHMREQGYKVSQQGFNHWLHGSREPGALAIKALAEYLGVSADWLLGVGEAGEVLNEKTN